MRTGRPHLAKTAANHASESLSKAWAWSAKSVAHPRGTQAPASAAHAATAGAAGPRRRSQRSGRHYGGSALAPAKWRKASRMLGPQCPPPALAA